MAKKGDLVSDQGYRGDGRRVNELRRLEGRMGVLEGVDGSAYLEQGNSKVLVMVNGPHEVKGTVRRDAIAEEEGNAGVDHEECIVIVQWKAARFSHAERGMDRAGKDSCSSIQDAVKSVLLDQGQLKRTQIDIHIHVLQFDGGVLACAINAVTLALMDAGVPMVDFLVACQGILYQGDTVLLDGNLLEEQDYRQNPVMTLVIHARTARVALLHIPGPTRMPYGRLSVAVKTVQAGAQSIYKKMQGIVNNRNCRLYDARQASVIKVKNQ